MTRDGDRTPDAFRGALIDAEQWADVDLGAFEFGRVLELARDAAHRRRLAGARRLAAQIVSVATPEWWRSVDGETLAILASAALARFAGLRSVAREVPTGLPAAAIEGLYTYCCVIRAINNDHDPTRVLRALAVVGTLGEGALDEVSRRMDKHIGTLAGAWRLLAEAAEPAVRAQSLQMERRLRSAAKARARRPGGSRSPWLDSATDSDLDDAVTMALAEMAGGKRYPVAEQAMAHALDGRLNSISPRIVNRGSTTQARAARYRELVIDLPRVRGDGDTVDDPIERVPATAESSAERRLSVQRAVRSARSDRRLGAALRLVLSDEDYMTAAAREGVSVETIGNWVKSLSRLMAEHDPVPHAPSRRGRRPKPGAKPR